MKRIEEIWTRRTVRDYSPERKITIEHMRLFFEAAVMAPSSFNLQPWRFWYAQAGTHEWDLLSELLLPANLKWAVNADWLVLVGANLLYEYKGEMLTNSSALFDVGAACMAFSLQVTACGFGSATIGGFSHKKAAALINNTNIQPVVMMVVGSAASLEPRAFDRKSFSEVVFTQLDGA